MYRLRVTAPVVVVAVVLAIGIVGCCARTRPLRARRCRPCLVRDDRAGDIVTPA
jgi:hypothetical protein